MPLAVAEVLFSREGLGGPVLAGWGNVVGERPGLIAAAGQKAHVFIDEDGGYGDYQTIEVGMDILSLAVGLPGLTPDNIILGTEDRVVVYGNRQGVISRFWETEPEPGAFFVDLALADLDMDGREEIIAAAEGKDAIYVYRLAGEAAAGLRLELLAIRVLPGPAQKVVTFRKEDQTVPVIAAAYRQGDTSGILTLIYTEGGFMEGPAMESATAAVRSLAAGDLRPSPGEELAWGGADGRVRVVETAGQMVEAITTDNLGSSVPALVVGKLAGERNNTLIAGTPEGYLFGFRASVEQPGPDWTVLIARPVYSMAVSEEGRLAVGTADGAVQVWRLREEGVVIHVVQPGETLFTIAARYNTTAPEIAEANRIQNPDLIFPGQELVIPV